MSTDAEESPKRGSEKGRAKHRSPNYPLFDLEKALDRARVLYDTDKTHKVPIGVVHERWGHRKFSAIGNQAVAAVKSYGLIAVEGDGDQRLVAVTERGRRILLGAADRADLVKEAALMPPLFASIWEQYRLNGIPSSDVLKHYLVFDRSVNEDVVDKVVERFLSTITFAHLDSTDRITDINSEFGDSNEAADVDDESESFSNTVPPKKKKRQVREMEDTEEYVFGLAEGPATLICPNGITTASVDDLQDWLNLIVRKIKRLAAARDNDATSPD